MQQQQPGTVTHSRISSLLISRRLTRPRVASRYSVRPEGSATACLGVRDFEIHVDFGFHSGFLDFTVDFWISQWISGFQFGFLPTGFLKQHCRTVYEISFVTDPSVRPSSYILYECVHVTESGRGNPKNFPARFARQ